MAWTRMAMVNWVTKDEEQARRDIARAMHLAAHATEREQLFIRAWSQVLNFNTSGALATVDTLVTRYPDEKEGYLLRGNLNENNKNLEAANQSYQQAINVDTAYAQAVMSFGYVYSTPGDRKSRGSDAEVIRLAPEAADPRAKLCRHPCPRRAVREALEQYRKSLELKPDYWYAIREIGNIYMAMGRLKEAKEQFHASLKLLPRTARSRQRMHNRTDCWTVPGKYEDAVRLFNEAMAIDSNNVEAASGSVYALAKLRKFDEANQVLGRIREEIRRRNLAESPPCSAII